MKSRQQSPIECRDLSGAEIRWGGPDGASPLRVSDLWRLASRLPFAVSLARAAVRDPRAFWITALAVRRHRALQKPLELCGYLSFLRRRRILRIMEIGTLWGGTFFAHCAVTEPSGHVIAMDSFPDESAEWMSRRYRRLARTHQRVTCIWKDSHASDTVREVEAALKGASLDVLFLDGDHSFAGVKRDFDAYSPFVRTGGVIAFHDIASAADDGVPAFWRSLQGRYESVEFVDRVHPPQGLGIGVIVKG